jgi:N-acetylglutamate synthase-like GNAT family acetyltransferase
MEKRLEKITELKYSEATNNDLKAIAKILHKYKGDSSNMLPNQFLLAKAGDKIIGCIRIKKLGEDSYELASLVVLPEYRSRGIGGELINKIINQETCRPIFLLTSPEKETFYNKYGFKLIKPEELKNISYNEYRRVAEIIGVEGVIAMVMR